MESPQATKSGLNLLAGMSLRGLRHFQIVIARLHTFGLIEKASPVKDGTNEAYARSLNLNFSGLTLVIVQLQIEDRLNMSPNKNMLRFKTEHSGPSSPFSPPSVLVQEDGTPSVTSMPPTPAVTLAPSVGTTGNVESVPSFPEAAKRKAKRGQAPLSQ